MFELMFTSFPAVIQYVLLRRRGEPISLWNMKTALFLWAMMAFGLFLTIFYYHPKTYAGVVPFATVSVVAQTAGPVTEIHVANGARVEPGDLLFRIEDSAQRAALAEAEAQLDLIAAAEAKAVDTTRIAQATVNEAEAELALLQNDLSDAQTLLDRGAGTADAVLDLQTAVTATQAELEAARAQLDLAEVDVSETLPAQRKATEATLEAAQAQLDFTEVRSFGSGTVTQLSLSVGSPASTLVFSPAMIIIPDRPEGMPVRVAAGFSQVAGKALHEGMPAELACDNNANLLFRDAILPARVVSIQPAVATGQVVPNGDLLDLTNASNRGSLLVLLEVEYQEHEALLLDGAGCIVQTYTDNLHGAVGHIIAVTGVVKAAGLRLKMLGALISGVGLGGGGH